MGKIVSRIGNSKQEMFEKYYFLIPKAPTFI